VADAVRLCAQRIRRQQQELELNAQLRRRYQRPRVPAFLVASSVDLRQCDEDWQRIRDSDRALASLQASLQDAHAALEQTIEDAAIAGAL
jgi:hypothetical protein